LWEREASVAVRGGVWQAGPSILTPFTRSLRRRAPNARVVPARFPAVAGALLLAYRQEGIRLEPELLVNVERDLAARGVA